MKRLFDKNKIFVLILLFWVLFLLPQNVLAAICDTRYPGDGHCVAPTAAPVTTPPTPSTPAACPAGESQDTELGICGAGSTSSVCCHKYATPAQVTLQVPLFGYTKTQNIMEYIATLYKFISYIIIPFSIVVIIIAGAMWAVSGGDKSIIKTAKDRIRYALIGLFIVVFSYFILAMLGLTTLSNIQVQYVEGLPAYDDYAELIGHEDNPDPAANEPIPKQSFNKYSGPVNMVAAKCVTKRGVKTVRISESIKAKLEQACKDVTATGYDLGSIAGGLRQGSKFCHGKSLAVDINVPQNYCVDCYSTKGAKVGKYYRPGQDPLSLTRAAVAAMKKNGWCWGGDWRSFKDYMHFSNSCSKSECAAPRPFNFSLSVQENHRILGITWP